MLAGIKGFNMIESASTHLAHVSVRQGAPIKRYTHDPFDPLMSWLYEFRLDHVKNELRLVPKALTHGIAAIDHESLAPSRTMFSMRI